MTSDQSVYIVVGRCECYKLLPIAKIELENQDNSNIANHKYPTIVCDEEYKSNLTRCQD